jgi:hypothetical protein
MVVAMLLMESSTVLLRNRRRSCYGMDEGRGAVL